MKIWTVKIWLGLLLGLGLVLALGLRLVSGLGLVFGLGLVMTVKILAVQISTGNHLHKALATVPSRQNRSKDQSSSVY